MKLIEMNFLPDVYVLCDVCRGARYNRETLSVKYKGKSIAELLDTTVEEALPVLENVPQIKQKLQTLLDVGLGYIKLGQSATTLSGGEAQRSTGQECRTCDGRRFNLDVQPRVALRHVHKMRECARLVSLGNTVIVIEHNPTASRARTSFRLGDEGRTADGVACGSRRNAA